MYIEVPVTWLNFLRAVEGVEDKSSRFAIEIIRLAGGANTTKQTFDRATCQSPRLVLGLPGEAVVLVSG